MAIDKQQVGQQIEALLKKNLNNVETKMADDGVNFSIPMKFTQDANPSPVHFACRVNDNFVESFCVMTMDFFDVKPGQEPSLDFYKLMNYINVTFKGTCSYFFTENALVCSAITPAPQSFDEDVFSFKTYNMIEAVGRYTASFYGVLNGDITFDELVKIYQQQPQQQ